MFPGEKDPGYYGTPERYEGFLGLNDRAREGEYLWTDSSPRDYFLWNKMEPSNDIFEHECAVINVNWSL